MTELPAAERAYLSLKDGILTGTVRGGDLLSEVEVGAPLGISRTPVHEAFLRLQAEGLLRLVPRRGAVVVPVEPGEATDVLEVRRALETAAVRRLAATGNGDLRATLVRLLATQQELADAGDVQGFVVADEQFHSAIVAASGNALSLRFYSTLTDRQRRMALSSIGARTEHLTTLVAEHRRLAEFIERGDPDGFDTSLTAHLTATHAAFLGGAR
ncbi:GntR family transcriptional regulator [Kribbella sp. NPDC004875]|uniref:GntR family transcriptional regulator n=1 Tax=Kribbella sp. NPDC004875 TaxID=3364107 RepID=UPI0036B7014E